MSVCQAWVESVYWRVDAKRVVRFYQLNRELMNFKKVLSTLLVITIKSYQRLVSPLLGPHCRFEPTCSCYGIDAINQYGPAKGTFLLLKRVLKCHPFHKGGADPA